MACITGLSAQIKMALPWTPVPITGQTLAVLLSGVLLGSWWGGISQIIYITMGVAGIPWFANFEAGYSALIGPTGGYLIGFILTSIFVGYFTDKYIKARSFHSLLILMVFANFILIYIPGLLQLAFWLHIVKGSLPNFRELLSMGFTPFILGDITKIILAAMIANGITTEKDFIDKLKI